MNALDARTADAFRQQIAWCRKDGVAPFTADLIEALLRDFLAGGAWRGLFGDWPSDPVMDAVPLRGAGALHRLALKGCEPFRTVFARLDREASVLDEAVRLAGARADVAGWLANPPQTNEVMRAAVLIGGFMEIARARRQPLRLLEVGCSAGLNLLWDRYRYRLGGLEWGPEGSLVRLEPEWTGPEPPIADVRILARRGADQLPIDVGDPEQRVRLLSYVWAEQADRVARLRAALDTALTDPPPVDHADAAEWVEAQLSTLEPGVTTVLYHSYVWMYLPQPTRQRIRVAVERAGALAGPQAGLAYLTFETSDGAENHWLELTLWPGGERRRLARAHPHGRWINWLG